MRLWFVAPTLLALLATGCFRASGLQRTTVVAEAIPEVNGDRVSGLKSTAGPGDYYLGNDFVQVAIDGTRFGDTVQNPIAGAASGGSIVDAGYLNLDTSYQRVNMPSDSLERLTPVVNQDPTLEMVFDSFVPDNTVQPTTLTLTGHVLDPNHKIPGAMWDSQGLVQGVSVVHVLSLAKLDRFVTLSTTIENTSGSPVGIRSIGDFLSQTNGGYKFAVPAGLDVFGSPLATNWGVEIPGSNWSSPIATAVQSPMIALMATEPGTDALDGHASLGIMSQDAPYFMVTSDPQDAFTELKPVFPHKLVAGNLPLPVDGLAAGASLTYNRRLYISGGTSNSSGVPNQATYLFNVMTLAKFNSVDGLWPQDYGDLIYTTMGSAMMQGPLPTEIRVERQLSGSLGAPVWVPERIEWQEPGELMTSTTAFSSSSVSEYLPAGTYRLVITNKVGTLVKDLAVNSLSGLRPLLEEPIYIYPNTLFNISATDYLCPEAGEILDASGNVVVKSLYQAHFFDTRPANALPGSLQPLRITIKGTNGTPDPSIRRSRTMGGAYSAITKAVAVGSSAPGQIQFRAGNEMFGTAFYSFVQTRYFWLPNGAATGQVDPSGNSIVNGGTYTAYGTRGPLSTLNSLDVVAYDGQYDTTHSFIVWPQADPVGWTTFDLPGPSLATTGGYLPGEKLASGMAEGVHVVGTTEMDVETDGDLLYNNFTWEMYGANYPATRLTAVGTDPFVVSGRSSNLPGFGIVTSLFTPAATPYRFGGALQPANWTLGDFITQAKGLFTIVHQPRGPQGLFTLTGFDPTVPVGQGANQWWSGTGVYANGVTNGSFDALELLRGEGFDKTNPDPWFQQFKQVRSDWFALLNQQTPANFTKALGLSSAMYSLDTPVGLARTYLKASPVITNPIAALTPNVPPPNTPFIQDLSTVQSALKAGAAVASTGPFLDVTVAGKGPGGLVAGPMPTATVNINLYKTDWMPVDDLRVVVNGGAPISLPLSSLTQSTTDPRIFSGSFPIAMPTTGTGAWIVVEAGVKLTQTGAYAVNTPWYDIMRGIYPIAVTNPIFVDVTGTGYVHP